MPKIISRTTFSASTRETDPPRDDKLTVYYCMCGEFAVVLDKEMDKLARRPVDAAYVLDNEKRKYKLNASLEIEPVILEIRKDETGTVKYEKQWRMHCPRCSLLIGYEVDQPRGRYTFLTDGLLREQRTMGRV